jgi:pseudaminic acid biosynthesis-associated methylase
MAFRTEQEAAWAGTFGSDYLERNREPSGLAAKIHLFSRILGRTQGIRTVFEVGANIGLSLAAMRTLLPSGEMHGIEINEAAWQVLRLQIGDKARLGSILDFESAERFDLVFTSGLLIHIDPDHLPRAYDRLHALAGRYLLLNEYFNPSPVEVAWRGVARRLFKRDFCGEMLDRFGDLDLVDYGFSYRRDPVFPQDNSTWFLLRRR